MPNVEEDPALARLDHHLTHAAFGGGRIVRERAEALGENVSGSEPLQNVFESWRGMVDMDHHWQPRFFRRLSGNVERDDAGKLRRVQADTDLDADDRVGVGVCDLDRFGWCHQAEIAALADHDPLGEPIDAGERHIEEGEDFDW